ncbi:MAG: hypothetical protein QMD12_00465 [Candidatus Aenigmarchaeota archaeon]|nr:hypothetical protein [Candidatus Aenigmarchaeota archaeon]
MLQIKKSFGRNDASQIARETKLTKITVSYLLNKRLANNIEEIIVGKKELFKVIKLK